MQTINDQVLSVSEYNQNIKTILEGEIAPGWVRGEVSNLRKQASGHCYFTLKDAGSQLSCVLFKGNALRQAVILKEGQQLLVYGEISVYEPRGNYQLIARIVLEDGQGQLQVAFEKLKQKLAAEGLFDSEKKLRIPSLPQTIGIVTSPTGAAVQDFISVLKRRGWKGRLVVLPSKVQGKEAGAEIVERIERAHKMEIFDLLVITRGGGSLEDLWPFNEEIVVRALAKCSIPTISAVGHEIDFTLSDFASDLRAETPTGAAEVISSHFLDNEDRLSLASSNLHKYAADVLEGCMHQLEKLGHRLTAQSPLKQIEHLNLKLDDLTNRMLGHYREQLFKKKELINDVATRLQGVSPTGKIQLAQERLSQIRKRLDNSSLESGLHRGFLVLKEKRGGYVTRRKGLKVGDALEAIFEDGSAEISVTKAL